MRKLMFGLLVAGIWSCGGETTPTEPESGAVAIPSGFGKDDNYLATSAKEYTFRGTATATLAESYVDLSAEEQAEEVEETIALRTGVITRAAKLHVQNVIREANTERGAGGDDDGLVDYFIYVKSSAGNGAASNAVVDGLTVTFDFELEFVGSNDLVALVTGDDFDEKFEITLDGTNGEPETIEVTVDLSPSTDAFPQYDAMFADGVLDIAIHFGGDYNTGRYDLETAKWTVEFLLESGWSNSSVATFEELKHDSPPFTYDIVADGKPVQARVYVYHAEMDNDAGLEQSLLADLVKTSVKERDIVIYSGHAGANAGMLLDYHPRYELSDDDFEFLDMRDEYQIWVFDGCNSYRTYVDKLLRNPARTYESTDIVTTVNTTPFSAGYEIINRFVHWFVIVDQYGAHIPLSWNTLLQGVNDSFLDVHYGVHGIDNSPKLNPHGGAELMCQPCSSSADCGGGGNECLNYEDGAACSVACTDSAACGEGFECIALHDDPDLFYIPKQCVRTSLTCG